MAGPKHLAGVDDDHGRRGSLVSLMEVHGYRVESYASGAEFAGRSPSDVLSCLLVDLQMPQQSGLELIRELRTNDALPPTIVLTGHATIEAAVQAMKLGARDFLEKPCDPDELIAAVNRASGAMRWAQPAILKDLPRRQVDVLKGLMKGQPNKVIAFELGLSTRTIEHYRAALMARAGVKSLPELVRLAIAAGL